VGEELWPLPNKKLDKTRRQKEMTTKRNELKDRLLKHYGCKEPHPFVQFDGFLENAFTGEPADDLHSGTTHELMSGGPSVRILITPETSQKDALRLIKKIRGWIKNSDIYARQQKDVFQEDKALDAEKSERCGKYGNHHSLCKTSLSSDQVKEAIATLEIEDDGIPF
jgi:hypothetical protein